MKGSDFIPIFLSANVSKHIGIFGVVTSPLWDGKLEMIQKKAPEVT